MLELAMICCLAVMGIYFVKSTDLPKELTDRSAQFKSEEGRMDTKRQIKITLPREIANASVIDNNQEAKLAAMKLQKKEKEIKLLNEEIDKLTMTITALEQEIRVNNERNAEIQSIIDSHLISLQSLQDKITALA